MQSYLQSNIQTVEYVGKQAISHIYRQIYMQSNIQTIVYADKQAGTLICRQTGTQEDRQSYRNMVTEAVIQAGRHIDRKP